MSKQTINIGASPNDGTGTPLRTSFDYTNQNFTELYTALGGGVGLPGATTQVIFNDGGTNLAGDAGLVYNKTTDTLTAGNATITGDLTVDTSTLKVDSTNNRVGVVQATPLYPLHLVGEFGLESSSGDGAKLRLIGSASHYNFRLGKQLTLTNTFEITPSTAAGGSTFSNPVYTVSYDGIHTFLDGAGGTRMTLNSTGLGIGASPAAKLHVTDTSVAAATALVRFVGQSSYNLDIQSVNNSVSTVGNRFNFNIGSAGGEFSFSNSGGTRMYLDQSGNVGIGITPSAWASNYKSVQVNPGGGFAGKTDALLLAQNCYFDGTNWVNNRASTYSSRYDMNVAGNGIHAWYVYNASFGTVGNTIPFTQAMTLDASGYLLLGTTDTTFTSGAGYKFGPGATPSNGQVGASSSNGDLTLRVYSTGAAAYRFYVGFGGTVFATSATISAISDARLKENVQNLDVGLNEILALKPRKFDWKAGKGKDIKGDRGFIAQEFETVFPNLIDEWADPAPEGEAPYKSVRQDLIPVLVKAIQELTARVQTLETR